MWWCPQIPPDDENGVGRGGSYLSSDSSTSTFMMDMDALLQSQEDGSSFIDDLGLDEFIEWLQPPPLSSPNDAAEQLESRGQPEIPPQQLLDSSSSGVVVGRGIAASDETASPSSPYFHRSMYLKFKKIAKRFTSPQLEFLREMYDRIGSNLSEKQAHLLMKTRFNLANGNQKELLSEKQIKGWFSSETSRRKKALTAVPSEQNCA